MMVFWFKKKVFYLLCLLLFLPFIPGKANAHDSNLPSELENNIIGLINLTRLDPVTVGQYLGIDTQSLFSDIPPYSSFYASHKWSLRHNQSLSRAAISHCLDMFDRDYFSSVTPEGKKLEQRAADQEYQAIEIYEYMSILSLVNYIQPEKAFFELFRQFFLDQVAIYKNNQANIFDYRIRDLGVSFRSGNLTVGGKLTNVYLLVITYGISKDYLIEYPLMRKINLARKDHIQFLDHFGIEKEIAAKALNGFLLINLIGGLSPLVFYSSSSDIQFHLNNHDSPKEILGFVEHQTISWEETVALKTSPSEIAEILFEKLIFSENMEGIKAVFNFQSNAAIINLTRFIADNDTELFKVEFIFGRVNRLPNLFMGNVFELHESNDIFSQVQGLKDIQINLYNEEGNLISGFTTELDGSFRLLQEPGLNTWEIWSNDTRAMSGSYTAKERPFWDDIIVSDIFDE